jgi:3'-phosphoadenosine 5'-phosphosulfate sulfotransferase (PAPS reductase)/FAD synthetase
MRLVKERSGDTVLLAFSGGKDAISAWLAVRDHFRVVPYFMYLVPGLEFIEESLSYYERVLGTRIIRVPHPSLFRCLNNLVFQPPERRALIARARLDNLDYKDIQDLLRADHGIPRAYVATGVRAADSPLRRLAVMRHGVINDKKKQFWPVHDWRIADVWREIGAAGIKLPVDYEMFGRSFDGLDYRFLKPIKDRFPRDYARILEWFPLADLEIFRRSNAKTV